MIVADARQSLAAGRWADAHHLLRSARRRREGPPAFLALLECEALLGLLQNREAVAVVTRALTRPIADADVATRLRLGRAHALWLSGRVAPARAELARAAAGADAPLTRGRACELRGLFALRAGDIDASLEPLDEALALYAGAGCPAGLARTLGLRAGVLRDAGLLDEAVAAQGRRVEVASLAGLVHCLAAARVDRAALFAQLGRWTEAKREAEAAGLLYRRAADPREGAVAASVRGMLDVAGGDLPAARAALGQGRELLEARAASPRHLADNLLLSSDLCLAAGEARGAEEAAVEALRLCAVVQDREGLCRSRLRRSHALLALGQADEAWREAARAVKAAPAGRRDRQAFAWLTLGRCLVRTRKGEARRSFERALAVSDGREPFHQVARLGRAVAEGADRSHPEVRAAIGALESWADRWLLALCLSDLDALVGPERGRLAVASTPADTPSDTWTAAIVDAAHALLDSGSWHLRWAAAMRALRPAIGWWRTAVVGEASWELRGDLAEPAPLGPCDLARELAARCVQPFTVELAADPALRLHPTRVLHGLRTALVAPVANGAVLYVDLREGAPKPSPRHLALVAEAARLLSRHPVAAPAEEEPVSFPGLLGRCPAMQSLFAALSRVAASDLAVHLHGETGTGKERVAEVLHRASRRGRAPFVAINASSLSDELFESEVFGHVRGSFTGAIADREGYVVQAEGGTLFLDEVTDLSARGQAKLLRFLETREYRRLGEGHLRRADIRVVTASNVRLEKGVAEGRFREDLMYRLNRVVLELPPLRERGGDVRLLARHFLKAAAARAGRTPPALTAAAETALCAYRWPGNVRELENEMARLVLFAGPGPAGPEHLSPVLRSPAAPAAAALREAMLAFEREHITRVLAQSGGNRARTACLLGVTRQALVSKISRLGIASARLP